MPHIDNATLIRQNTEHWALASYHTDALAKAKPVAERLVAARAKMVYQQIERDTGVPWFIVAVIHEREASQRWDRQLGQGDPLNEVSRHVPKGRGPFSSFIDGADDALKNCAPYLGRWRDWSPGGALTALELYNGTGYESFHHMASPYVWGGSDIYHVGKYVADGKFDANVEDHQLGCAVLLKCMMEIDSSIVFAQSAAPVQDVPLPPERPARADEEDEGDAVVPPAVSPAPAPPAVPQVEQAPNSPPSWLADSVKQRAQDAIANANVTNIPKSILKSHIGWGTIGLAGSSTATIATQAPPSIWETVGHTMQSPFFWLILANIGLAGFVLYHYWRDHGKGSV